jgi:phage gpG-like protein
VRSQTKKVRDQIVDSIYEVTLKHIKRNFSKEGYYTASRGNLSKWKKRARAYKHPILNKTGKMKKSFRGRRNYRKGLVTFWNHTPYFDYHNKGMGHNPRRIMMNYNPKLVREIYKHIFGKLNRIL